MKSYTLAVALAMLLSALYAFQNPGDVTVRFLLYERTVPQGLWEVLLFSSGVVLMWLFSLGALLEVRKKYRSQLKAAEKRAEGLEEERKSLLAAFQHRNGQEVLPQPAADPSSTGVSLADPAPLEASEEGMQGHP